MLPGDLGKHAYSECLKAIVKGSHVNIIDGDMDISQKVGLNFPVAPIMTVLRMHPSLADKTSSLSVSTGCAAVLEYLSAEVLELGGGAAKNNKLSSIAVEHLNSAIHADSELDEFFKPLM